MAKCDACNSRIFLGGVKYAGFTLCNQACVGALKISLVDSLVPAEEIAATIQQLFSGPCPRCKGPGPVDVYSSDTVTGMLIAYRTAHAKTLSCVGCGRRIRLQAALHCLFLGWWGAHAAIHTVIYIPKNLLGALFSRPPVIPSKDLAHAVKVRIAEANIGHFRKAISDATAPGQQVTGSTPNKETSQSARAPESEFANLDDGPNPYRLRD